MTYANTSNKIGYRRGSFPIMKCEIIIKAQESYNHKETQEVHNHKRHMKYHNHKKAPGSFTIIERPKEVSQS